MIIDYEVENFRNFLEPISFSMEPLQNRKKTPPHVFTTPFITHCPQLMRAAAFYGPNASGKSSLFDSLSYLWKLIENSPGITKDEVWPDERNGFDGQNRPMRFHIRFLLKHKLYDYELELYPDRVQREVLKVRQAPEGKRVDPEVTWLERDAGKKLVNWYIAEALLPKELQEERKLLTFWLQDINPNQLLLSVLANKQSVTVLDDFIQWKRDAWSIWKTDFSNNAYFALVEAIAQLSSENSETLKAICDKDIPEFFQSIGSDITGLRILREQETLRFEFAHGRGSQEIWLSLEEQSSGTQICFNQVWLIWAALAKPGILLIDELDRSLHPAITRYIVQLFNNPESNPKRAQLLFSSHDVQLMDRSLLQPEQVYLLSSDNKNIGSQIDCIGNYALKNDRDFRYYQNYLRGEFGAVPQFQTSDSTVE